ncbi:HPP family protein [Chitinimonas sp. BJYL2]|uniref:HPP family protein n=1 Tax=Chitinimonas sp. BJYL2 TaxID=2976696 RepID=UPI0022B3A5A3|nr:HPP family protein [Chitinimonas sp. BJYL2]
MSPLLNRLRDWLPDAATVSWPERWRAGVGGVLGILAVSLIAASLGDWTSSLLISAAMGASAVIVFGLPTSPLGQPWPLVGGHLLSGVVGMLCYRWIPESHFAAALAVGLAIVVMMACRCVHPPGGATALTAVIGGPAIHAMGWYYLLHPVFSGALAIMLTSLVVNNLFPGRVYPLRKHLNSRHGAQDRAPQARGPVQQADMARAVAEQDALIDLTPAELEALYLSAERHAARRLAGPLRCGDIASRDVLRLPADMPAAQAWTQLHARQIDSAPVVDAQGRVVGLFAPSDMLRDAPELPLAEAALGYWHKHTVGDLAVADVPLTKANSPVADLLAQMSASESRRCLVLDDAGALVGVITQTDLIAHLFHQQLFATHAGAAGTQS